MTYKRPKEDDRFLTKTDLKVGDEVIWHKINCHDLSKIKGKITKISLCDNWGHCKQPSPHLRAKLDSYSGMSADIAYLEKINQT